MRIFSFDLKSTWFNSYFCIIVVTVEESKEWYVGNDIIAW